MIEVGLLLKYIQAGPRRASRRPAPPSDEDKPPRARLLTCPPRQLSHERDKEPVELHLSDLWFIAIAVLWAGYFVLEGFDFGVGILLPVLGRNDTERRVMINTIGPVWDGNEVWLLTAGGATFAAFPGWYAAMFSAFYLPLLLVLVRADHPRGRVRVPRQAGQRPLAARLGLRRSSAARCCPRCCGASRSATSLHGIPLNAAHNYTGNFFNLLNPYSLLGGVTTLTLFTLHGALFLGPEDHRGPARAGPNALACEDRPRGHRGRRRASSPGPGPVYRSPGHVGHRASPRWCSPRWPRSR